MGASFLYALKHPTICSRSARHRASGTDLFSRVCPSPGATISRGSSSREPFSALPPSRPAAPGDGRQPPNRRSSREFTESHFRNLPPRIAAEGNSVRSDLFIDRATQPAHNPLSSPGGEGWGEEAVFSYSGDSRRRRTHRCLFSFRLENRHWIRLRWLLLTLLLTSCKPNSKPAYVSGTIETDEVRVASRYGGRVEKILAQEGDSLKPGQVIVELEATEL